MGNEIAKKYVMEEEPSASGGLACLWKIYKATEKATGAPVSVFVFTKEDLKDVNKALREQVLVILRRELKVLEGMSARKHPSVVRHIETFEETKKLLAFVTERVSCSLADALGEGSNTLGPAAASAARRGFERYEVARGFFGLCEGLLFVHTIRRRLHLNLAPESIFLSPSGQFKLGGFGFSVDLPSNGSSSTPCPFFQTGARSGFQGTWRLHPVMAFSSPEATAPAGSNDVSCASDMFSLGCLMYQLCREDPRGAYLYTGDASPQTHQTFCATLDYPGRVNISTLYPDVQSLVESLIRPSSAARPLLGNVTINPIFHGTEVTVLKTIDGIPSRNPAEAATFLTSVRPAVTRFPLRVQRDCIMQPLMDACAAEPSGQLWAFALPIVTDVCEKLDRKEMIEYVQAKFRPALKAEPVEALASLVAAIPLMLSKMEVAFFRSDVVPMVCRALQAQGNPQIRESVRKALDVQEAALKAVSEEAFHCTIDGRTRELSLLPRVCWLVVKGAAVRVKVNALLCLSKTFHFFQVRAVVDKILPTLKFCAERDETVAIQLCVLGCYDAVAKRLERLGPVATHILPACTPMLACKGLNSNQFEMAVGIVQGMLETVITYRRKEIANPTPTAIIENKPTHAGGEVDEAELARQRAIVLGGWKPAPPGKASRPTSKPSSPPSSSFPSNSGGSSPVYAAAASTGFDIADVFSAPPVSTNSTSAPSASFSIGLTPTHNAVPGAPATLGSSSAPVSSYSAGPAGNMFQGLSLSQKQTAANDTASATMSSGSTDPFGSAGLGDAFGAIAGQGGGNSGSISGGMSWMDDAFGGGGVQSRRTSPSGGILPPPQPAAGRVSSPAAGAPSVDPFAAFFDSAIGGGPGNVNSPQMTPAPPAPNAAASGGGGGLMGGLGFGASPAPAAAGAWNSGGGGGVSETIEDQLAKTQREIAQLTRELGSGGMAAAMGGAMAAMESVTAPTGGSGSGGWGMPGGFAPQGGVAGLVGQGWPGGSGGSQVPPANQQQGASGSQDPFAFLGANS